MCSVQQPVPDSIQSVEHKPGWPYNTPMWRRHHRAVSPDGTLIAQINPAYEVGMADPTSGLLCISSGLHMRECNPSFVWSEDSQYLAVSQFYRVLGFFRRQRLLVIAFQTRTVHVSRFTAWYIQPISFTREKLVVSIDPPDAKKIRSINMPLGLESDFTPLQSFEVAWPES